MTREQVIGKMMEYFETYNEAFAEALESLDSWNGYLGDDRIEPMYLLSDWLEGLDTDDIFNTGVYARDEYGGRFDTGREYFRLNAYGNLVSTDDLDYSGYLSRDTMGDLIDSYTHINLPGEIEELIESISEDEEEAPEAVQTSTLPEHISEALDLLYDEPETTEQPVIFETEDERSLRECGAC